MTKTGTSEQFRRKVIISIAINLVALGLSRLLFSSWEASDDIFIQNLLYGVYGSHGTSNLVYLSRGLGVVLYGCAAVLPVNVYYWLNILTCLLSSVVATIIFTDKFDRRGIIVSFVWIASLFECYCYLQYSKTACVATIVGVMGIFYFADKRRSRVLTVISCFLVVIGYMIRKEPAYISVFLSFPIVVCYFVRAEGSYKEKIKRIIIPGVAVGLLVAGCFVSDIVIKNSSDAEREFWKYEEHRQELQDYKSDEGTVAVANRLIEEGDYARLYEVCMVDCMMNNDPHVFTADKMEELDSLYSAEPNPTIPEVVRTTINMYCSNLQGIPILLILTICALIGVVFSKQRGYAVLVMLQYMFMQAVTVYMGRFNLHRLSYVIMFAALTSLLYIIGIPSVESQNKKIIFAGNLVKYVLLLFAVVILIRMDISDSTARKAELEKIYSDSCEVLRSDERYLHFPTLCPAVDPSVSISRIPQYEDSSRFYSLGGWISDFMFSDGIMEYDFEGNPFTECIDSETVRVIMPQGDDLYNIRLLELYIESHYGIKTEETIERSNDTYVIYSLHTVEDQA